MKLAEVKRVSAHLRCLNIYEKRPQTKMLWSGKICVQMRLVYL